MADGTFTWGAGGTRITPEDIAARQRIAQNLYLQGSEYSPVASPWQGAARMAQALLGGYQMGELNRASEQNATESAGRLEKAIAASTGGAPAAPAGQTMGMVAGPRTAPVSAPMGNTSIPSGTIDPGLNSAISTAAAARGVDPSYMTRLAMVESGGDPNAASTLSSAKGPFQFINSTAKQYNLTNPMDPVASADAAARLTIDNKAALTQALGREPTMGELYLAHQQGAGGAAKLLANPNLPVETVIGAEAARNNGAVPGMTAGQFANKWTGKFSDVGGPAPAAAAAPSRGIPAAILDLATNKYGSEADRKMAALLLQNHMANNKVQTIDLGNAIGVMDANGNMVRSIPKGEPNKGPEFGVIGKDEYGNERYGWRDPRSMTEKPASMSMVAPPKSVLPKAPDGVDPKIWRDTQSKRAAEEGLPASDEATSKLRQEIQGLPSYKNIAQAAPVYKSMFEAAGRDNRAADVNMIYGMAKIMDPGSVVREGEMTIAQAISTLPQQLRATVQSQLTGDGRLTPEVRAQIMQEARGRMMSYQTMFDQDAGMYRGIAKDNRMRESHVIPNFGTFDEFKPPAIGKPVEIQSKDGVYKIEAR